VDGAPRIPRLAGRHGRDAYLHVFIPGTTLRDHLARLKQSGAADPGRHLRDDFFPKLQETLAEVHRREVGYADLSKAENVIVDEKGEPWLIDFQISWPVPPSGFVRPVSLAIFRAIAREDLYHLLKFKARYRPDQLTPDERARVGAARAQSPAIMPCASLPLLQAHDSPRGPRGRWRCRKAGRNKFR
jgi:hypothetical protein